MIIDTVMWFLVGMICGVIMVAIIAWFCAPSLEDKVLESLIMEMDYDVAQGWIEEEEERRRINK